MTSRRRIRRTLAVGLALTVLLTSCSSSEDEPDPADPSPTGEAAEGRPVGLGRTITPAQLAERFAGAGIATYPEAGAAEPVTEVETPGATALTQWQVTNMAHQMNSGRGYAGRDLDDLTLAGVPISVVLAAYASAGTTPGAELARELMGDQDWATLALDLVYPDAVVSLFVNDLATDEVAGDARVSPAVARTDQPLTVTPALAAAPLAGGICTDLQNLLSGTLDTIVENLQIKADGGVGGVLATIWNTVIKIAASAAKLVLEALTAPVMKAIRTAASVLAVLSSASALLDPWTVTTKPDPEAVHFAVGSEEPKPVVFTAHVNTAVNFSWPDDVKDCAGAAGVELPDPDSAKDSPVTWTVTDSSAVTTVGKKDTALDANGDATLELTPGTESAEQHDKGDPIISPVGVKADITRTAIGKLSKLIGKVLLAALPDVVADIVGKLLGGLAGATQAKLEKLTQVAGKVSFADINHHGEVEETPPPLETATPSPDCATVDGVDAIPDGTYVGPIELDVVGSGNDVSVKTSGGGEMTVTVAKGKVTGGPWQISFHSEGGSDDDGVKVRIDVDGTMSGKVTGPASAPVAKGSSTIKGTAKVTALGTTQTVPINESSQAADTLTLESTACDAITATWLPSLNAKTSQAGIGIEGIARWTGSRVE